MSTSEALAADSALALAHQLTEQAGFGRARTLSRLAGGKNNRVYRVDTEGGVPLVLKRYFSDPRDGRDRLSAEWNFLERAWQRWRPRHSATAGKGRGRAGGALQLCRGTEARRWRA